MWLCVVNATNKPDGQLQLTERVRAYFGVGAFVLGRPGKAGASDAPDITVPGDPSVSKQHCKLIAEAATVGTGCRLEDSSRYGTTVNGTKLDPKGGHRPLWGTCEARHLTQ